MRVKSNLARTFSPTLTLIAAILFPETLLCQQVFQISGVVTNCFTHEPVPYVRVEATRTNFSKTATTDAEGRYSLTLDKGMYNLVVRSPRHKRADEVKVDVEKCPVKDFCLEGNSITTFDESTTTLTPQNALRSPASGVFVVPREKILRRGYTTLSELLDDIPEVNIHRYSIEETRDYMGFRGITGNEKILVLIDGIRLTAATGDLHAIGFNHSLADAEQVEVIMGPASAIYGVDAFAGVVNIVTTKLGVSESEANCPGPPRRPVQVFLRGEGGLKPTFNKGRLAASLVSPWKDGGLLLTVDGFADKGPDFPSLYPEEFRWYLDSFEKNLKVRGIPSDASLGNIYTAPAGTPTAFKLPTRTLSIHGKAQFGNLEVGYANVWEEHSSSSGIKPEYTVYNDSANYGTRVQTLYGRHDYRPNRRIGLRSIFSYNTFEGNKDGGFVNTYINFNKAYKYQLGVSRKLEEIFEMHFRDGEGAFKPSFFMIGASYESIVSIPKTGDLIKPYDTGIPAQYQNQYFFGGENAEIVQDIFTLRYQNYGGFAQLVKTLEEDEAGLSYTLGLRYDKNTRYEQSVNPRAGLVYKTDNNLIFKALYGKAFLSPSPSKAYAQWGSFVDPGNGGQPFSYFLHLPNPDLQPEKLSSLEFSAIWELPRGWDASDNRFSSFLSLNGFLINARDIIEILPGSDGDTAYYRGFPVIFGIENPKNLGDGKIDVYGATLKFEGEYEFYNGIGLSPYVCATLMRGKFLGRDTVPYIPKYAILSGLDFSYKKFSLSPRVIWKSKMFGRDRAAMQTNQYESKPYLLLNLMAQFKPYPWISTYLRFTNLLNARYHNVVFGGNTSFLQGTPQEPLTIQLGFALDINKSTLARPADSAGF